jgi:hypothetical protein
MAIKGCFLVLKVIERAYFDPTFDPTLTLTHAQIVFYHFPGLSKMLIKKGQIYGCF